MKNFPVVCVGGSAGGLDAFIRLLKHLPADMGVAVVIVNHITVMPTLLHKVLPQYSLMPVELITEDLLIQPDHVYIIPANRDLHVDGEVFHLAPISKPRGWPDVITVFLRCGVQPLGNRDATDFSDSAQRCGDVAVIAGNDHGDQGAVPKLGQRAQEDRDHVGPAARL